VFRVRGTVGSHPRFANPDTKSVESVYLYSGIHSNKGFKNTDGADTVTRGESAELPSKRTSK
jgi:hypothetical protein